MEISENGKRKRRPWQKHQDLISQLSDDILVSILSHLNLREATATSILSSRWRYLPTYITRLNFPSFIPKFETRKDSVIQGSLIRSFPHNTNTIDRVLDSYEGCSQVKEFRVHMFCWEGANLNRWFEFALARDVEIIHIHMDYIKYTYKHARDHYSLGANLNLVGDTLNYSLKELSLLGINVNDGEIQLLLDKFPLLESLSIGQCSSLKHVSIVGHSSSKLKHLGISQATHLKLIEIDSFENLVSIWCTFNSAFSLNLKNVPKLTELSMSDMVGRCTSASILSQMSYSIHDQIQTLKIFTDPLCNDDYIRMMPSQLIGVKKLELQSRSDCLQKYWSFNPLYIIRACPLLEKLEVKFWTYDLPSLKIKVNEDYEKELSLDWPKEKVCPNLKRMKISGFIGSSVELEFIFSILKNINTLEELAVETCAENKNIRSLATRIFRHRAFKVVVDRLTVV